MACCADSMAEPTGNVIDVHEQRISELSERAGIGDPGRLHG